MKKLMTAALAAFIGFACFADESIDVFDVKITANTPYINKGVRDYRSDTWTGKLRIVYDEEGFIANSVCELTQKKTGVTTEYEVKMDCASVVGKKFTKPNMYFTLTSDYCVFNCAGRGSFKTVRKAGCGFCGEVVTECKKVGSVSGKCVGMFDCFCGENSPTRQLVECGVRDEVTTLAAMDGSFTLKYNKKESVVSEY